MNNYILLLLLALPAFYNTQEAFKKNTFAVSCGYGIPHIYRYKLLNKLKNSATAEQNPDASLIYASKGRGPIYLKLEYGITNVLSIGLIFGQVKAEGSENLTYSYITNVRHPTVNTYSITTFRKSQSSFIGTFLNYHFVKHRKLDPYINFAVGFMKTDFDERIDVFYYSPGYSKFASKKSSSLYVGANVGLRFYLTSYFGIFGEIGYDGWSIYQAGIVFKTPN